MRVMVTGGSGFVGATLCARLTAEGHAVIVLTRSAKGGGAPARRGSGLCGRPHRARPLARGGRQA